MFPSTSADDSATAVDPATAFDPATGTTHDRALARAVVGVTGDKSTPSWKSATTPRTRRRVLALQAVVASEAAGTVALIALLPVVALERDWAAGALGLAAVLAALAYAISGVVGADRITPANRVRTVQLVAVNGAVLTVLCGFLPVLAVTVILVVVRGAVYGYQASALRPLIYDAVVPEARVRAFARVAAAGLVGAAVGAAIAGVSANGEGLLSGIVAVGVLALLASLLSLRITDPGLGGVEPARLERAFGASSKTAALRSPMRETVARVMQVHTVRTSLSTYVAIGALSYSLLHPWIVAMRTSPAESSTNDPAGLPLADGSIFTDLAIALAVLAVIVALVGNAMEKARRTDLASLVRAAWLYPGILGGIAAISLALYSGGTAGAAPLVVMLALGVIGGVLGKVALDVTTLSVVSASDRPAVAGITNFSWAAGAALGFLVLPLNAGADLRTGFLILGLLLFVSLFVGRRLMQQPDADFDAVLPIAAEDILAETPVLEDSGLAPEVSPYAYIAPPPTILDDSGRPPLLSTEKLNFAYGSVPVLFDVDVTVGAGELVAVLGPNGVGKTTLLRCLSGLEIPQQGVVRFDGQDVTKMPASRRVAIGLSQIVGGNAVFGTLSVAENLQMYGYSATSDKAQVQAGIQRAYEVFPRLADRRNQLGSTLSGGEQQMLGLSKALILKPKLLVVDEFSLGLAPVVVAELLSMVRALNAEGTAVLLVEQSVNVALNLVDRCYFMEKGRVIHQDRAQDLLARPDLVQALSLGGMPHELEGTTA